MTAKEVLTAVAKSLHITVADIAKAVGWTQQKLNGRLLRNTITVEDFLDMMDKLDIDVKLTVRSTGRPVRLHSEGYGRRVRAMVNKVTYDTATSEVLANNFYADGVNEYNDGKALELYVDKEGRYFFAEYSSFPSVKDRITPVSDDDAAAFVEKYGEEIFKGPKAE